MTPTRTAGMLAGLCLLLGLYSPDAHARRDAWRRVRTPPAPAALEGRPSVFSVPDLGTFEIPAATTVLASNPRSRITIVVLADGSAVLEIDL